jgi:hypothetical protein
MPKILTRLRIDEVSAVDRGAGDGVKIVLMKRASEPGATPADTLRAFPSPDDDFARHLGRMRKFEEAFGVGKARGDPNYRSVATGAIYPKGSLFFDALDEIEEDEENDRERDDDDGGGDDESVAKADRDHRGPHQLAGALVEHLHDRLSRRREQHGFRKSAAKEKPMSPIEPLEKVVKAHGVEGIVEIAKNFVETGKTLDITEEQFVKLIDLASRAAHPELGALAFEKIYANNPILARAINVIKVGLAEQLLSGGMPVQVVGGPDAMHQAVDDTESSEAYRQLQALGQQLYPQLTEAQAFAKVFEDPKNAALAARAHRRPSAPVSGAYPMPR